MRRETRDETQGADQKPTARLPQAAPQTAAPRPTTPRHVMRDRAELTQRTTTSNQTSTPTKEVTEAETAHASNESVAPAALTVTKLCRYKTPHLHHVGKVQADYHKQRCSA